MPVKRRAPKGRRVFSAEAVACFEARDQRALARALNQFPWAWSPLDESVRAGEMPDYLRHNAFQAALWRSARQMFLDLSAAVQ